MSYVDWLALSHLVPSSSTSPDDAVDSMRNSPTGSQLALRSHRTSTRSDSTLWARNSITLLHCRQNESSAVAGRDERQMGIQNLYWNWVRKSIIVNRKSINGLLFVWDRQTRCFLTAEVKLLMTYQMFSVRVCVCSRHLYCQAAATLHTSRWQISWPLVIHLPILDDERVIRWDVHGWQSDV